MEPLMGTYQDPFKEGQEVRLRWDGFRGVAKWMSGGVGKVIKVNRTRCIVEYRGTEYSFPKSQLIPLSQSK